MKFAIKETSEVYVELYPFAQSFNKKIVEESKCLSFISGNEKYNADGGLTNVRALQTTVLYDIKQLPSMDNFINWLLNLANQELPYPNALLDLRVDHFWLANYNKGDHTISHKHTPAIFSFVYFVQTPKGSSPLVFTSSGKKVKAEEGKMVIFSGHVLHHVPKNRCNGKIVIAGNIIGNFE